MEENLFEVRWTRRAQKDLEKIIDEIAEDAPIRALTFGRRIQEAAASLNRSPFRCPRIREDPTCRHCLVIKYRIIYEIDEDERVVWIDAIMFPYQLFKRQR